MLYHKIHIHSESPEWVVFIHGAGGSSAIWFKQIRAFREVFNVLLLDLRGHGGSRDHVSVKKPYSLQSVCDDVFEVMDHRKIERAHFIGVSLGTVLMRSMLKDRSGRIQSMVMAGAITHLNPWARLLIVLGNAFKHIVPFRALYASFAFIIMPGPKAKESRAIFRREARKVSPAEFRRWLTLTAEIQSKIPGWRTDAGLTPTLYAMGAHDYIFLPPAKELAETFSNVSITVLRGCGHVCNVEQPELFNDIAIGFIQGQGFTRQDDADPADVRSARSGDHIRGKIIE